MNSLLRLVQLRFKRMSLKLKCFVCLDWHTRFLHLCLQATRTSIKLFMPVLPRRQLRL